MNVTPTDLAALRLLRDAEELDPPGLAVSNVTSAEFATIYHQTAERLLDSIPAVKDRLGFEGNLARDAGRDRYLRQMIRITVEGGLVLDQHQESTTT